jgi:transcriptional regulator with XRE-family HTH domain
MSIDRLSIRQVKAARELLGWHQSTLAEKSGVSMPTIMRLEAKGGYLGGRFETQMKIRSAFDRAGLEFTDDDGPGVRLRAAGKKRKAK